MIYSTAMKNEAKRVAGYLLNAIAYSAVLLIILFGTIAIYYYSNGYRFDFKKGEIELTGVLTVETTPNRATLILNGTEIGRTPKTVTSVEEGIAQVEITREGYSTWTKNVPIKAQKSSPIFPYLIKEDPELEVIYQSDEEYVKSYINENNDYLFFVTKSDAAYTIWRYDLTRNFWDLTENPKDVYTAAEANISNVDLNISPDGKAAILTVETKNPLNSAVTKDISLLHTVRNGVVIEDLDIENFMENYTFSWSNDSKFIVMNSERDIVTLKVSDKTKYLPLRKTSGQKYVWTTDTNGFLYVVTTVEDDDKSYFTLSQMLLDGTNKSTLIEKIYSQQTETYINEIRGQIMNYVPFTNAPENTRFSGEITAISVDQETGGLFIQTTMASYWYNSSLKKYILINPYPSKFISFSPDKTRLLFEDSKNKTVGVFTLEKEESDHVTQIGSKTAVKEGYTNKKEIDWLYNSRGIVYRTKEDVRIVDLDGENDTKITRNNNYPGMVDGKDKNFYRLNISEDLKTSIERFEIN